MKIMSRINTRNCLFIPYFYNNAIYVGSKIFVKVNIAVSSANQKRNALSLSLSLSLYIYIYIYIYKLPFYPFCVGDYFVSQPKKYADCRLFKRECQGILQEG